MTSLWLPPVTVVANGMPLTATIGRDACFPSCPGPPASARFAPRLSKVPRPLSTSLEPSALIGAQDGVENFLPSLPASAATVLLCPHPANP